MTLFSGFGFLLIKGAGITLLVSASSLCVGLLFGFTGAGCQLSRLKALQLLGRGYTTFVRGVPELLLIFLFYFGGTNLVSRIAGEYVEISPFLAGTFALSLIFGAYSSETLRVSYQNVSVGLIEAAKSLGMNERQTFLRIRLPLLFRLALPALGNLWLVLLKESALISVIGLNDLMRSTQIAIGFTKEPFKFYVTAAALYLLLTSLSGLALKRWERAVHI